MKKKSKRTIRVREEDILKADIVSNFNGINMPRTSGFSIISQSMPTILKMERIKRKRKKPKIRVKFQQEFEE